MIIELSLLVFLPLLVSAASRITPPAGALIVRQNTTTKGEFGTISAAVNALPADTSKGSVFIFPGTYAEQVNISRKGPTTVRIPVSLLSIFSNMTFRLALRLHSRHFNLPQQYCHHHPQRLPRHWRRER